MEPISRLNRVMGQLRARESSRLGKDGRPVATSHSSAGAVLTPIERDMRSVVIDRLRGVDIDTPQGARQGIRIFLEAVFRAEMGQGTLSSARFNDIISEVQSTLADDPATHDELLGLLRSLQTTPPRP
jgi:hypothetical protein